MANHGDDRADGAGLGRVLDLLEDLEQQAEALERSERQAEVADRARAEYRTVALAERLHATVGARLRLDVGAVGRLSGVLRRSAADWSLLEDDAGGEWLVPHRAVTGVEGAADTAVAQDAWSVFARLGWGAALRGLAEDDGGCILHLLDGSRVHTRLARVGADFVEHVRQDAPTGRGVLVPFDAVAAVQVLP